MNYATFRTKAIEWFVFLMLVIFGVFVFIETDDALTANKERKILELIVLFMKIVGPFVMILRSNHLRNYSVKFLKDQLDNAFMLSIYVVPAFVFIVTNTVLFLLF